MCTTGNLIVLETKEQQNGQIARSEPPSTHLANPSNNEVLPDVGLNHTA